MPMNFLLAILNPFGAGLMLLAVPMLVVFIIIILRLLFQTKQLG